MGNEKAIFGEGFGLSDSFQGMGDLTFGSVRVVICAWSFCVKQCVIETILTSKNIDEYCFLLVWSTRLQVLMFVLEIVILFVSDGRAGGRKNGQTGGRVGWSYLVQPPRAPDFMMCRGDGSLKSYL